MTIITISEQDGVRDLHFGTPWIQGSMRLAKPDAIELEYVQQMMIWTLFRDAPAHIVQLGLGAGALTKFCYRRFPSSRITAVELSSAVIQACREHFALPPNDDRLDVLEMDAMDYVTALCNRRSAGILQVDLYDAQARGPVLDSAAFYRSCANSLDSNGIMTVNLYCALPDRLKNLQAMEEAFEAVAWLPEVHDGNVVAIAFKRAPSVDFSELFVRAHSIGQTLGLPAASWVSGLQSWMQGD